jgi:hypothetical protein
VLKASIIYYPGSGGSFLFRVLTLSEKTIMGTGGTDPCEPITCFTKFQRLERYLNLGGSGPDWKKNEGVARLSYKLGVTEFIDYETSSLWLIDKLHPSEYTHFELQNLWEPHNMFEHFVFVDIDSDDQEFLAKNEKSKIYNFNYENEQILYKKLSDQFVDNAHRIKFKSFFDESSFVQEIQEIDLKLNLELDFDLVKILWRKWFFESTRVWKM